MENEFEFIGSSMGLYDSRSDSQGSVVAEKVIDITAICSDSKQVIIKYANVTRGLIAQICNLYEKGKDLGSTVHYHINEMSVAELAEDAVFERTARVVGAKSYQLAQIIFDNAPKY